MAIRAGELDQRVTLETPVVAINALGEEEEGWLFLAERFARVIEAQGREFLKGDYRAEEKIAVKLRWIEVDSTARVTWRGRVYRVVSVTGTFREGETWLHCVSAEGAN